MSNQNLFKSYFHKGYTTSTMLKAFLALLFIIVSLKNQAQNTQLDSTKNQKFDIKMKNGEIYTGLIVNQDRETLTLKTVNGEIKLLSENIKAIEANNYSGKFAFDNPHQTRYFFGPSAFPIKRNKGYYQNIYLSSNFVNYGITDNISLGGGLEFFSTLMGNPIWFLTPKIAYSIKENIHIGGGFIMAGFATEGTATLAYGVGTYGNSESNVSLGVGYGYLDGKLSSYPAVMFSGTHRVTNSISLLSENYIIPNKETNPVYFGIQGIRILSAKNSFDVGGMIIPAISSLIPAIPFVGYSRVF